MGKRIVIGTRGSQLSLVQTNLVKNMLQSLLPTTKIDIEIIHTEGDRNMSPVPLDTVGKGWFTKELDKALLAKKIDLAVHSLKDIPEELPPGLLIAAIPQREDAREALVSLRGKRLDELKKGATIGTDSTRRKAQILHMRPDLQIVSLRGNVNRRLAKLDNKEYDGIFLAVAGLKRLGFEKRISQYFDEKEFIPSPGQGALAIVIRKDNTRLKNIVKKLNNPKTVAAVLAERQFSKIVGGGCKMPVGAYAKVSGNKIVIHGVIGSLDGKHVERQTIEGPASDAQKLGETLAKQLLEKCKPWYTNLAEKYVVLTRPAEQEDLFSEKLQQAGLKVFPFSTISVSKKALSAVSHKQLADISSFDWIVFTSRHGITHLLEHLKKLKIDSNILHKKKIAAVGPKTAEALQTHGISPAFIPTIYTTEKLGKHLPQVKTKKILLARSNIANPVLTEILKERGATVVNIPIYKTVLHKKPSKELGRLVESNNVLCVCFTSPSTIDGFMKSIPASMKELVVSLPILSIGPVTTAAAEKFGFQNIYTAKTHTTDGMLTLLRQNIL